MMNYKTLRSRRYKKQVWMAAVFILIIAAGWIYPLVGYLVPLCMLIGMILGIARGRKWCDFYCPRGSFFDTAAKAFSPQRKIPALLRGNIFRAGVLVLLIGMISLQVTRRWPDFFSIGSFFVRILTLVTVLGVVLAMLFHQRTWCSFCPVGSLSRWFSNKAPLFKIDSELCRDCSLCARVCPVQIDPSGFKSSGIRQVADKDCLRCGLCAAACTPGALKKD